MMGIGGAIVLDEARRLDDAHDIGVELIAVEAVPRNVVERPRAHAAPLRQDSARVLIHPNARKIRRWRRRGPLIRGGRWSGSCLSPGLSCAPFGGKKTWLWRPCNPCRSPLKRPPAGSSSGLA